MFNSFVFSTIITFPYIGSPFYKQCVSKHTRMGTQWVGMGEVWT